MARVSLAEFEALVGGLTDREFRAFVADVWRARGFTVEESDAHLHATDPGGSPAEFESERETAATVERIYPVTGSRAGRFWSNRGGAAAEATTVVHAGERAPAWVRERDDLTVVDVGDLYNMVLYGIDRQDTLELFRSYFEREPVTAGGEGADSVYLDRLTGWLPAAITPAGRAVVEGLPGDPSEARTLVVLSVVFVLVVVVAASVPTFFDGGEPVATETPTPSPTPADRVSTLSAQATPSVEFPPGVGWTGLESRRTLVAVHTATVSNSSYRLELTIQRATANRSGFLRETSHRETATRYSIAQNRAWPFETGPRMAAPGEAFANGERRYNRIVSDGSVNYTVESVPATDQNAVDRRAAAVIERLLAAEESGLVTRFVRDGRMLFRIALRGDALGEYENVSGTLLLDERGVIHALHVTFRDPETGSLWEVDVVYDQFGSTTANEPKWLEEAKNATNSSASPTAKVGSG